MEQDKIMSAEEFFEKQDLSIYERYSDCNEVNYSSIYTLMRRYAKYHRKLALEAASEKIISDAQEQYGSSIPDCWSIESILNAYPEDLIR